MRLINYIRIGFIGSMLIISSLAVLVLKAFLGNLVLIDYASIGLLCSGVISEAVMTFGVIKKW